MDTLLTFLDVAARVLGLWFVAAAVVGVLFVIVVTLDRRRHYDPRHRAGVHARGRS